ncbi:MAG: VRR-NUC domain-containing protein [Brevundimonas sp.]|uniref:VRR-NUC domain-containing protein n=1 Tax=Brevundimonas sp. TaxID=1871086 RepID=UPI0030012FB6
MSAGPEDILQVQVLGFLKVAVPDCVYFHCPNGGSRHPREAKKLKSMGVRPGVADLCFVLPGGRAAFIELKAGAGRQTASQALFQEEVTALGSPYAVCRSISEVQSTLEGWGLKLRGRLSS